MDICCDSGSELLVAVHRAVGAVNPEASDDGLDEKRIGFARRPIDGSFVAHAPIIHASDQFQKLVSISEVPDTRPRPTVLRLRLGP